jgi:hypothetical protein
MPARIVVRLAAALAAAAVLFGAVTLVALEGRGVAVLHTKVADAAGGEHRTHVWAAIENGAYWVEAATASRPFYLDLAADPHVAVELRAGPFDAHPQILHGHAELVREPGGHEHVRELLRAKYGWADQWVALLQDTSASRAVRITIDPQETAEN